jgi:hypothetical protein
VLGWKRPLESARRMSVKDMRADESSKKAVCKLML